MSKADVVNSESFSYYEVAWGMTKGILAAESGVLPKMLQVRMTQYKPFFEHSLHTHPAQEEVIYVVSGKGFSETAEGRKELFPGCAAYIPAGVGHATINPNAEPLVALVIKSPPDAAK
ncbi:MAG: cupin domain-containing protein [Synergistaceae bacterium]|nr:cupin domain-containing protein [Synergistaceae bacterium]